MELRRRPAPDTGFTVAMKTEEEALQRALWLVAARSSGLDRELIEAALNRLEKDTAARAGAPWAELPIAVHQRLRGSAGQAVGLAAITTLLQSSLILAAGGVGARKAAATVDRDLAPAGISCLDEPPHRLAAMRETLPCRPFHPPGCGKGAGAVRAAGGPARGGDGRGRRRLQRARSARRFPRADPVAGFLSEELGQLTADGPHRLGGPPAARQHQRPLE
jgi:hypothetical protein